MAETTTATSLPASTSRLTRRATFLMRSISATEVPPNFCTMRAMSPVEPGNLRAEAAPRLRIAGGWRYPYSCPAIRPYGEAVKRKASSSATRAAPPSIRAEIERSPRMPRRGGTRRASSARCIGSTRCGSTSSATGCWRISARDPRSLQPFAGLTLLDIGCGGGLIAEPMARLGFAVTGIDADAEAIAVAARPCRGSAGSRSITASRPPRTLAGRASASTRAGAGDRRACRRSATLFSRRCGALVEPGGAFIVATLNRTPNPSRWRSSARNTCCAGCRAAPMIGASSCGPRNWSLGSAPRRAEHDRGLAGMQLSIAERRLGAVADDLSVNYMVTAVRR